MRAESFCLCKLVGIASSAAQRAEDFESMTQTCMGQRMANRREANTRWPRLVERLDILFFFGSQTWRWDQPRSRNTTRMHGHEFLLWNSPQLLWSLNSIFFSSREAKPRLASGEGKRVRRRTRRRAGDPPDDLWVMDFEPYFFIPFFFLFYENYLFFLRNGEPGQMDVIMIPLGIKASNENA